MSLCSKCKYFGHKSYEFPCDDCLPTRGYFKNFVPKIPEQPTILPMPPVKPPKEETNRPLRIDVMVDVFGIEVTKHFCLLNAFKCLWGAETEKSKEDVENAVWYLNEYIKLGDEDK